MMSGSSRRVRRSAKFWRELVAAQSGSGGTVAEFCAAHGVGPASFYTWRKRLVAAASPSGRDTPRFVAVRVAADAPAADMLPAMWEVVLPEGVTLRMPAGSAPEEVARLAAALRGAGC